MGGERTHRLLFVSLTIVLAGLMAIPAKLMPSGESTRVAVSSGTSEFALHPSAPAPAGPSPSPPRREHPIQAPSESASTTDETPALPFDEVGRDRPPIVRAPTTAAAKTVFALVIGINHYPSTTNDLRGAVPDAEDMSDALAMNGVPAENVRLLLDADASTTNISNGLQWLDAATTPDSTVVIFYAGHVRKLSDQTEAIVAADGGVLPDWYLAKEIEPLPAHDVWIVMASCYGGGFTEMMAPGRILTAAADANSLAYENDSFDRSYLDEYLVNQGLLERMAAGPTAQQAFTYAQAALQRDYPDRTLTEFDQSTEMISLDGVHRDAPPPPSAPSNGDGGSSNNNGSPAPNVPSPPPSSPPQAPPPCRNPLGLLCPPGSR